MKAQLSALYGLKWNPFTNDVPTDALWHPSKVDHFLGRVEHLVGEGGFALVCGEVGHGKSCTMRLLEQRLGTLRDVTVGACVHPQSRVVDFYRELGDIFGVPLSASNRWGSFKVLREKWQAHIAATLWRPVLLIDEAQEMEPAVLNELRILSSTRFDSHNVLTVCLAGDMRLRDKLQQDALLPLASRIRIRLQMDYLNPADLADFVQHTLQAAGNPHLLTRELAVTLCERAAGNLRVLCNTAAELLAEGAKREVKQLDEKLYLELFGAPRAAPPPRSTARRR
jgi:type II secretory pathway predicted ATPase ExeA